MSSSQRDVIDFAALERELKTTMEADVKYRRENEAKLRAVHQGVASYREFRDIVLASHLKPLVKNGPRCRKQPWNPVAASGKQDPASSPVAHGNERPASSGSP